MKKYLRINYFHQSHKSRGLFDPFKPKQNTLNAAPVVKAPTNLKFMQRASLPESAKMIYIGFQQSLVASLFLGIKTTLAVIVGGVGYVIYKSEFDVNKFLEFFNQQNPNNSFQLYHLPFFVVYIALICAIFVKFHRTYTHSIFYDSASNTYYLVRFRPVFGVKSEAFKKEALSYRYEDKESKSLKKILTKNFGNFNLNGKLQFIDGSQFVDTNQMKDLLGPKVYNILVNQKY